MSIVIGENQRLFNNTLKISFTRYQTHNILWTKYAMCYYTTFFFSFEN